MFIKVRACDFCQSQVKPTNYGRINLTQVSPSAPKGKTKKIDACDKCLPLVLDAFGKVQPFKQNKEETHE